MPHILIYDSTDTDRRQLEGFLNSPDTTVEFIAEPLSDENVRDAAEIISLFVTSQLTEELIKKMPGLRLVACRSTGYNNINLDACRQRGVAVVNVPTYGEHTVAEFAFTLILALSRKLLPAVESVQKGQVRQSNLRGFDLNGKTLGVVGAGRIGKRTIEIGKAFGMKVQAYDPMPDVRAAAEAGFKYADLHELMRQSDIITIHAPYTEDNRHLINKDLLDLCKPEAILINTARGELVDTAALVDALQSGKLAGAGLDVLEGEGLIDIDEELLLLRGGKLPPDMLRLSMEQRVLEKMPNVIITPHNAFNTLEAIRRINQTTAENIKHFMIGEINNQVKPPAKPNGKLILARHAESEWNAKGVWTGNTDVHLSEKGFRESALLGQALGNEPRLDYAYVSQQIRTFETLEGILDASQQFDVPYERAGALNERDYGDYTGKNKWEVKQMIGETAFHSLRRDWDYPVKNGETLKMVYGRVVPFYKDTVLPRLRAGQNVLVVAHGNSLRALIKYLESISDKDVADLEMPFGNLLLYDVDDQGLSLNKQERIIDTTPPPA